MFVFIFVFLVDVVVYVINVICLFVVVNSIQETDGGYFEAFTALAWKRDNRRMSAVRTAETRAEMIPEKEHDAQASEEINDTPDEKEQLYIEVLQTIANAVGAPAPGQVIFIFAMVMSFFPSYMLYILLEWIYTTNRSALSLSLYCNSNECNNTK